MGPSCNLEKNVRRRGRGALLFVLPVDPPTWPLLRAPDREQPARPSLSSNSSSSSLHFHPSQSLHRAPTLSRERGLSYPLCSPPVKGPALLALCALLRPWKSESVGCLVRESNALRRAAEKNPINLRLLARAIRGMSIGENASGRVPSLFLSAFALPGVWVRGSARGGGGAD